MSRRARASAPWLSGDKESKHSCSEMYKRRLLLQRPQETTGITPWSAKCSSTFSSPLTLSAFSELPGRKAREPVCTIEVNVESETESVTCSA